MQANVQVVCTPTTWNTVCPTVNYMGLDNIWQQGEVISDCTQTISLDLHMQLMKNLTVMISTDYIITGTKVQQQKSLERTQSDHISSGRM